MFELDKIEDVRRYTTNILVVEYNDKKDHKRLVRFCFFLI